MSSEQTAARVIPAPSRHSRESGNPPPQSGALLKPCKGAILFAKGEKNA
ncbi:MAG: hypothetical protein ACR2P4_04795 [Gammaproteobacteria bacterium]